VEVLAAVAEKAVSIVEDAAVSIVEDAVLLEGIVLTCTKPFALNAAMSAKFLSVRPAIVRCFAVVASRARAIMSRAAKRDAILTVRDSRRSRCSAPLAPAAELLARSLSGLVPARRSFATLVSARTPSLRAETSRFSTASLRPLPAIMISSLRL